MSNSNGSLGKAGFVIGIVAAVLVVIPMFIPVLYFALSSWLVPILVIVGAILSGIAMSNKQEKATLGLIFNVGTIVLYIIGWFVAYAMAASAVVSAASSAASAYGSYYY